MIRINLVKSKDLFVFLLFVIVIAGFYSRLIIRGSFPGDFDTWANLAMIMELKAYMESLFTGGEPGAFLYPNEHTWIGYGLDFFSGIIWVLYSWLGLNDYLAYWFCILTILVLNSYSVYLLSGTFLSTTFLRVVLGLLFSTHFYVYPFLDWPNLICLFPVFFGAHALARYFKTENEKYLLISGLWLTIQLPLSPYVFTYTLLFAGLSFCLFPLRILQIVFPLQKLRYFLPLLLMFLLYSVFYLLCFPANLIDPLEQFKGDARFFLWLDDIIRPSHLHPYNFREGFSVEVFSHKNLFLGFVILGLSIYGLSRNWKLLVVLIFLLLITSLVLRYTAEQQLKSKHTKSSDLPG